MRTLFTVLFVMMALPALAQQERECRGKQAFDLGDGAYGCLFEVGTSEITTTLTRDDGANSSARTNQTGKIEVLMFGEYNGSKRVTSARLKTICQTFLPNLRAALPDVKYSRIVLAMIWPRVENPGDFVEKSRSKVAIQPAFSSASCRGIRYFG